MKEKEEKMHLPKVTIDDFFTTQEERDSKYKEYIEYVPLKDIDDFINHPFSVIDDELMDNIVKSINDNGFIPPAIIRRKENGRYEMVAGHRRKMAFKKAHKEKMPCIIKDLTDDEATILMVDTNINQRQIILPSERAFAYKMKLGAEKHQGIKSTCGQKVHKSRDDIADDISGRQVQRYIRLTELIPELLKFVDNAYLKEEEKITMALAPAVEISYLTKSEQDILLETIETTLSTPSTSQAKRLRQESENKTLTEEMIHEIMEEEKPNQQEQVKLNYNKVKDYFPKGYTVKQMQDVIENLLQKYKMQWKNKRYDR